jgi:hypothetical protein
MTDEEKVVKSKRLLTASRMACLLSCQRKHYWRYEIGLRSVSDSHALRFGTAWHVAMENRWQGMEYTANLQAVIDKADAFTEFDVAMLAGMLAGYYARYDASAEIVQTLHPEQEFDLPLPGSRSFDRAGKIDGLGVLFDGRLAMVEHKTSGEDIGDTSDYWQRLRWNPQVYQYVDAARTLGHDVEVVLYDVARKPMISPLSNVPTLDAAGLKIVNDAAGQRCIKRDGQPKQTADKEKGEVVVGSPESPEQFCDRLIADTKARPEFYFARREVPILEQDLAEFEIQRMTEMISSRAANSSLTRMPPPPPLPPVAK